MIDRLRGLDPGYLADQLSPHFGMHGCRNPEQCFT